MRASIIAALVVLGSVETLHARNEPFFHVSICSWDATDILVLTPTLGKAFRVVETIKGGVEPGELLVLDELAPPDDVAHFRELRDRSQSSPEPPPLMEAGDRMMVFLLRAGAQHEFVSPQESPSTNGWQPANGLGDTRFSAVWLRHGEAFAFFQIGIEEAGLHDFALTEEELRHGIHKGIQLRASLDRALELPADSVARAIQLAELVRSDDPVAPGSALKYLAAASSAAGVVLRELLSDPKLVNWHSEIERALAMNDYRNSGLLLF